MTLLKNIKYKVASIKYALPFIAVASYGQITETITIKKDLKLELPTANRIFEKIPPISNSNAEDKQMKYQFYERKPTGIEEVKFSPNVVQPEGTTKKNKDEIESFNNYIRLGGGNYGRIYGEAYINSSQDKQTVWGIHAFQNTALRGPVDTKKSGLSLTDIDLTGKYQASKFSVKAGVGYDRKGYYFYGYTQPVPEFDKSQIKQVLNTLNFNIGFENTVPQPKVDYAINTRLRSLSDNFSAKETDWGSNLTTYFPIYEDKVVALLGAEAFMTQRTDGDSLYKRNLFRVEPGFKFNFNQFGAKVAFRAVNEFDEVKQINRTKGFPVVELTYKTQSNIYFFAGYEGDIIRNTLYSYLGENLFLGRYISLLNTEKNQEYYIGGKADLNSAFNFNLKASYGFYKNLYFFNTLPADELNGLLVNRFHVLYEPEKTGVLNISTQLNFQPAEMWRTNLKLDYMNYDLPNGSELQKPYHRPNFTGKLGNTLVISDKIVAGLDLYYFGKTFALEPNTFELLSNKSFVDLNAEFNYLFSKQFTAFVKLNNIIGQKYQRYINYPQQGLNFLVGVNFSF